MKRPLPRTPMTAPRPRAPSGKIPGTNTAYPSGCGQYVNWTNPQVTSCPNPGTTSCIQLRADAVGYAVTALLQQAQYTETYTGISNQFSVGLYPFIVNLCTASAGSSNACSVGQTTSLTGSTITNFAQDLASLLDNGGTGSANSTLGSGGTHFENALSSMNSFITSVGTGGSAIQHPALRLHRHRRLAGLPNAFGQQRSLGFRKLDLERQRALSKFRNGDPAQQRANHRLLRSHEKPRHHGGGPLYSL